MANGRLVVSELLCYLFFKFKKYPIGVIKQSIIDFYDPIDIAVAKDVIMEDAKALNLEKLPRKRRDSIERRNILDVDDIISVVSMLDERNMIDMLPSYVVKNIGNVPLLKMDKKGEFRVLKSKVDNILNEQNKVAIESFNRMSLMDQHVCALEKSVQSTLQSLCTNEEKLKRLESKVQSFPAIERIVSQAHGHSVTVTLHLAILQRVVISRLLTLTLIRK